MTHGSSYEVYEKTHSDYDKTRLPVGNEQLVELIEAHFSGSGKKRGDIALLDAGCGTGGHLQALSEAGFTALTGLDASVTGLAQAAAKLKNCHLVCGDIRCAPFADGSFDVVIFSFVLHHLPHTNKKELTAATSKVLGEAKRLLAPGGLVAVITCTPEQMSPDKGCMWYYSYFSQAASRLASRFLPATDLQRVMRKSGLRATHRETVQKTYWTAASLDPHGPQDPKWRSGDSLFALCQQTPELFQKQLLQLERDVASGAAQKHIAGVRARAEIVKQAVIITAKK